MMHVHLRERARSAVIGETELSSGKIAGAQEMAICFADLVGFTKLGERVPSEELGSVAGRLAEMAAEVAEPPVRMVKTIGDAAMLVSDDADCLLKAALELVEAAEGAGDEFPSRPRRNRRSARPFPAAATTTADREPGQPHNRLRPPRQRGGRQRRLRGRRARLRLVADRQEAAEGHQG